MNRLHRAAELIAAGLGPAQGIAGVASVTGGTYLIAGTGQALIALGVFLILAALFSSLGGARR